MLLSIESWTPHAVGGSTILVIFHVVNDKIDGQPLAASTLEWSWVDEDGHEIQTAAGEAQQQPVPEVVYYGTRLITTIEPNSLGRQVKRLLNR